MKKKILIISVTLVVIATICFVIQKNKSNVVDETDKSNVGGVKDKKEVVEQLQTQFQTEGLGFIVEAYQIKGAGYLVLAKQRSIDYDKEYPGDQLIWVVNEGEKFDIDILSNGDHKINLVLDKEKNPYYLAGTKFLFSFYEGEEINGITYKGKGYVYEVEPKGKAKKALETDGDFYDFGLNKEEKLMFIEKQEINLRNQYPSYFSPYVLIYKEWKNGKWIDIKEKEVTPNIKEEHEKMIETLQANDNK